MGTFDETREAILRRMTNDALDAMRESETALRKRLIEEAAVRFPPGSQYLSGGAIHTVKIDWKPYWHNSNSIAMYPGAGIVWTEGRWIEVTRKRSEPRSTKREARRKEAPVLKKYYRDRLNILTMKIASLEQENSELKRKLDDTNRTHSGSQT